MSTTAARLVAVEDRSPVPDSLFDVLRRRVSGTYELDPWGYDDDAARVVAEVMARRWSTVVIGADQVPSSGPALLVANRRMGWSEPAVVATALRQATGRAVRPVGGLGVDPFAGLARRVGLLPARPEEVVTALRAGNLVVVPTRREPVRSRPGHLPIDLIAAGLTAGVPLVPVAVIGWELGRHWTVRIGAPVHGAERRARSRRGQGVEPRAVGLAAVEVAASLTSLLALGRERDLKDRALSLVPGVGDNRHGEADDSKGT